MKCSSCLDEAVSRTVIMINVTYKRPIIFRRPAQFGRKRIVLFEDDKGFYRAKEKEKCFIGFRKTVSAFNTIVIQSIILVPQVDIHRTRKLYTFKTYSAYLCNYNERERERERERKRKIYIYRERERGRERLRTFEGCANLPQHFYIFFC